MMLASLFVVLFVALFAGLCAGSLLEHVLYARSWMADLANKTLDAVNRTLDPVPTAEWFTITLRASSVRCDYTPPPMLYGGRGRPFFRWTENGTMVSIFED
jgi:hypothetical protein